jgi:hypothetical protein
VEIKTIQNYGGPYVDQSPLRNPQTQLSATRANRLMEDAAQLTRTSGKSWVSFPTALINGAIAVTAGRSHFGTGSGQFPVVTRTGTGLYTITYAASYTDAIDIVETVGFVASGGIVRSLVTSGHVQTTEVANIISVAVFTLAGAASDLGGSTGLYVWGK